MELLVHTPTNQLTLGQRIERARAGRGWSREALASRIGTSVRAVQLWETDQRAPRYATLLRLGRGLGCSLEWLMTGAKPNPESENSNG